MQIYLSATRVIQFILSLPAPLRFIFINTLFYIELAIWYLSGEPIPPPKAVKVRTILKYSKKYRIQNLIETGTYLGETVELTKNYFKKVYSIELAKILYKNAKNNFSKDKNVTILFGDSATILPKLIKKISEPILFWLDAHFSEGVTARGLKNTPIMKELTAISKIKATGYVILIDDARAFTGISDYPTSETIKKYIGKKFPNYKIIIKDDMIQIYPSKISNEK